MPASWQRWSSWLAWVRLSGARSIPSMISITIRPSSSARKEAPALNDRGKNGYKASRTVFSFMTSSVPWPARRDPDRPHLERRLHRERVEPLLPRLPVRHAPAEQPVELRPVVQHLQVAHLV